MELPRRKLTTSAPTAVWDKSRDSKRVQNRVDCKRLWYEKFSVTLATMRLSLPTPKRRRLLMKGRAVMRLSCEMPPTNCTGTGDISKITPTLETSLPNEF